MERSFSQAVCFKSSGILVIEEIPSALAAQEMVIPSPDAGAPSNLDLLE